jgi:hypothetical protein
VVFTEEVWPAHVHAPVRCERSRCERSGCAQERELRCRQRTSSARSTPLTRVQERSEQTGGGREGEGAYVICSPGTAQQSLPALVHMLGSQVSAGGAGGIDGGKGGGGKSGVGEGGEGGTAGGGGGMELART